MNTVDALRAGKRAADQGEESAGKA